MKKLYRTIPVIKDLLFILKNIDEKRRRNLYYFAFISVFNAFCRNYILKYFFRVYFISDFPTIRFKREFGANHSLIFINRIYYKFFGIYLEDDVLTSCILFIIVTVFTAFLDYIALDYVNMK